MLEADTPISSGEYAGGHAVRTGGDEDADDAQAVLLSQRREGARGLAVRPLSVQYLNEC